MKSINIYHLRIVLLFFRLYTPERDLLILEMKSNKTVQHIFMPGHTIAAAIQLHNKHNVTPDEFDFLLKQYVQLNGDQVLKAGQVALIPILERHE